MARGLMEWHNFLEFARIEMNASGMKLWATAIPRIRERKNWDCAGVTKRVHRRKFTFV